jgi:hypothetical protein
MAREPQEPPFPQFTAVSQKPTLAQHKRRYHSRDRTPEEGEGGQQSALRTPHALSSRSGADLEQRKLLARVHEHRVGDAGVTLGDQELREGDGDADLQPVGAIQRSARFVGGARATPTPASPIAISSGRGPLTTRS